MNTASPNLAMPAATLLAAGLGRRMGGVAKPALMINGQSLFERLVMALRQAGVCDVSAVIGPYRETLLPLALRCGVAVIPNQETSTELAVSQRLAVNAHLSRHRGRDLMLLVSDLPLLTAHDIRPLLQAWRQRGVGIQAQVPIVDGVRGHPLLLSWTAVQAVAAQPVHLGVRDWLRDAGDKMRMLEMHSAAYTRDLDTPEDLASLGPVD